MKKIPLSEASGFVAKLPTDPSEEPVIVVVGKRPVAVIYPIKHSDLETVSLSINPKFQAMLERSRRSGAKEGYHTHEEVGRMFGLTPGKSKAGNGKPKTANRKKKNARHV